MAAAGLAASMVLAMGCGAQQEEAAVIYFRACRLTLCRSEHMKCHIGSIIIICLFLLRAYRYNSVVRNHHRNALVIMIFFYPASAFISLIRDQIRPSASRKVILATPDLYKRWTAFGMLSTHSRLHGNSSRTVTIYTVQRNPLTKVGLKSICSHTDQLP